MAEPTPTTQRIANVAIGIDHRVRQLEYRLGEGVVNHPHDQKPPSRRFWQPKPIGHRDQYSQNENRQGARSLEQLVLGVGHQPSVIVVIEHGLQPQHGLWPPQNNS